MLIADIGTAMAYVDVERKLARKAGNNARGAIGRDVISVLHYSKTHWCNPRRRPRVGRIVKRKTDG